MKTRLRPMVVVLLAAAFLASLPFRLVRGEATQAPGPAGFPAGVSLDLRLLVISADGHEADLPAIRQVLDYLGTPYVVYVATSKPGGLTADKLSSSDHGFYYGVVLATGNLASSEVAHGGSVLNHQEWQNLWAYEAQFGVRQLAWYAFPGPDYGFKPGGTGVETSFSHSLSAQYTSRGRALWGGYVNTSTAVPIEDAYTYLAQPLDDGHSTVVLTFTDVSGAFGPRNAIYALAVERHQPDGRETLALTFDSNADLLHDQVLAYGLIDWVTRGLFLGERHAYLAAQVDDVFIDDDLWLAGTPCGTSTDHTGAPGLRISGSDLHALAVWQQRLRASDTTTREFKLFMAFNGSGVTDAPPSDTLVSTARQDQGVFGWINHTYDHLNLDAADYDTTSSQIEDNNRIARDLGLSTFSTENLITPDISAISPQNPAALQAAYDRGVRYLVTDTSHREQQNPTPNAGIWYQGTYRNSTYRLLGVPRHPTNLFYNVSDPGKWTAEYNCIYRGFFGRDSTYQEILSRESDTLLRDLLKGDVDPIMFHEANLRVYDGTHSLLEDLLEATLTRYQQLFVLPPKSETLDSLGRSVAERMDYNDAHVSATLINGDTITLRSREKVIVPITGPVGDAGEQYGGENISHVSLAAQSPVILSLTGNQGSAVSPSVPVGGPHAMSDIADFVRARVPLIVTLGGVAVLLVVALSLNRGSPRSSNPGAIATPEQVPSASPSPLAEGRRRPWNQIHSWTYWLNTPNLGEVGKSQFELAVIDVSDGTPEGDFHADQIEALRHASCERRVVAYLSIGEADNYRFYWHSDWKSGNPSWIVGPHSEFPGAYYVRYWDPEWQKLVYQYLDRIIAQGFDGVYLDRVDAYQDAHASGHEEDMVAFVKALAAYARSRSPLGEDFGVIAQNAEELGLGRPEYVRTLTAIAREDTYVNPSHTATFESERRSAERVLADLYRANSRGNLVLTVDYTDRPDLIAAAYSRSLANGFVPYVTSDALDSMRVNPGHEPQCQAFSP